MTATLLRCMGFSAATTAAEALARGVFDLNPPVRRHVEKHLAACGGFDPIEAQTLARSHFEQFGRFWVELLYLRRRLNPQNWREFVLVQDPADWRELACSRRPLVLVTADLGNPAVAALAISQLLPPLTVVVDPVARALIASCEPMVPAGRLLRWPGLRILDLPNAASAMDRCLASGGRLLFLLRPSRQNRGVTCRLLGQMARFPATPVRLAIRHQAGLVLAGCVRLGPAGQFSLSRPVELPSSGHSRRDTQSLVDALGDFVLSHPEQFLWLGLPACKHPAEALYSPD